MKRAWCIVPFHRPSDLQNLSANFIQQTYQNKKLCVIENGSAIGVCKANGFNPDLLLTASSGPAEAINVALAELRKIDSSARGFKIDADDEYRPEYLTEAMSCADKTGADIVGKGAYFMRMTSGNLWLLGFKENTWGKVPQGPTLSGIIGNCEDFPDVKPWGEDAYWCARMIDKGAKVWMSSRYNFCQHRGQKESHTWQVTDEQIRNLAHGIPCWDIGTYSSDIVD